MSGKVVLSIIQNARKYPTLVPEPSPAAGGPGTGHGLGPGSSGTAAGAEIQAGVGLGICIPHHQPDDRLQPVLWRFPGVLPLRSADDAGSTALVHGQPADGSGGIRWHAGRRAHLGWWRALREPPCSPGIEHAMSVSTAGRRRHRRFSARWLTVPGVVLMTAGFLLASVSTRVWQLLLTQGLLYGVGSSMLYFPLLGPAPEYFTRHRATAMGLILSGGGIGGLVLGSMLQGPALRGGREMDVACPRWPMHTGRRARGVRRAQLTRCCPVADWPAEKDAHIRKPPRVACLSALGRRGLLPVRRCPAAPDFHT